MSDELRTVAAYPTPIEADLARGRLQSEGIQAFVADDQTIGWFWHLGVALHGVKVMVREADVPGAAEILRQVREPPSPGEAGASNAWRCPKCGAEVDGDMEVCWSCGTTPDGQEDPTFVPGDAAATAEPPAESEPPAPGPWLGAIVALAIPLAIIDIFVGLQAFRLYGRQPGTASLMLALFAFEAAVVVVFFHGIYYRPVRRRPDGTLAPEAADEEGQRAGDLRLAVVGDWNPDVAEAVRLARRACFTAVLGVGFCPPVLTLYSCWLMLRYDLLRPEVRQQAGRFVYAAVALNAIVLVTVAALLWAALAR